MRVIGDTSETRGIKLYNLWQLVIFDRIFDGWLHCPQPRTCGAMQISQPLEAVIA